MTMRSFLTLSLLLALANGFLQPPITPTRALTRPLFVRMDPNDVRIEFSSAPAAARSFTASIFSNSAPPAQIIQPTKTPEEPPPQPQPKPRYPVPVPSVTGASGDQLDVVSRLLKDRILMLGTDVNDEVRI